MDLSLSFKHAFTALSLALLSGTALSGARAPSAAATAKSPTEPNCSTVYAIDNKTGQTLEDKNTDTPIGLASLAKLFTVAGAQIAMREELGFENTTVTFGAPKDLVASKVFHYESCTPHVFKGKNVTDITLSPSDSIRALMTVSANPVSYGLFDRVKNFFKLSTLSELVQKIATYAGIPAENFIIAGNDPSGMNSALRCNPGTKTPEDRNDHKGTARGIAKLFNFITDFLSKKDMAALSERTQTFGPLSGSNTNPFSGYKGVTSLGKTGTVTGIAAGVFRITDPKNPQTDMTMVLYCKTMPDRTRMGEILIDRYAFQASRLQPLDISRINGNSSPVSPPTAISWHDDPVPAPSRDF